MKLLAQGAEAKLYSKDESILKERFEKKYRIPEIDNKLRKFRTRREAKILTKLEQIKFPAPRLNDMNDKNMTISMEKLDGPQVKDVLEEKPELAREIGKKVRLLHDAGIIHSDLTTSNMIFTDEVYFIDFGLSFFSDKTEDKAVDLHLLKEALESKHHQIWEDCFKQVLKGYGEKEVIARLEKVEKRGRNKGKKSINFMTKRT